MNIYVSNIGFKSGKTVVSAAITAVMQSLGYNTGVYKPVETGAELHDNFLVSPDLSYVKSIDSRIAVHSSFMYKYDDVPSVCAEVENKPLIFENIKKDYDILSKRTDVLLVESPGGLMTPLTDEFFAYNIPHSLNLPVVFVVKPLKNNINYFLNELNTAKISGLDICGIIINEFPVNSVYPEFKRFPSLIEKYSDTRVIGVINQINEIPVSANSLISEVLKGIDMESVFRMPIPKLGIK